jgi:hypothetical protein
VFTGGPKGLKITEITDGLSNTILAVETAPVVPWTKPADVAYDAKKPLPKFGGVAKRGFLILTGDGTTAPLVRPGFNERALRNAITPQGGEGRAPVDLEVEINSLIQLPPSSGSGQAK